MSIWVAAQAILYSMFVKDDEKSDSSNSKGIGIFLTIFLAYMGV